MPGVSVVPHYDAWPEPMSALVALQAPRGSVVLGIDEETAVIGRDGAWQVHGAARVTVWRGRRRERHRAGEVFRSRHLPARTSAGPGRQSGRTVRKQSEQ